MHRSFAIAGAVFLWTGLVRSPQAKAGVRTHTYKRILVMTVQRADNEGYIYRVPGESPTWQVN